MPDAGRAGSGHRSATPRAGSHPRRIHRLVTRPAGAKAIRFVAIRGWRSPLSGFHAGNRYSLVLGDRAFQQALTGFHQRFYQGGQITLSLCGPQSLDELEQLGRHYADVFETGIPVQQDSPPALVTNKPLLFAHNGLPAEAEQALELLIAHLGDNRPGSWLDALEQRGWLKGFKAQTLHAFAGQLLWHIDLELAPDANSDEALKLLHGWFDFIGKTDPDPLNRTFGCLQQRRQRSASALELARRDSAGQPFAALDAQALRALEALLEQLPRCTYGQWQLPAPEPLLSDELPLPRLLSCPLHCASATCFHPPGNTQHCICVGTCHRQCASVCTAYCNVPCAPATSLRASLRAIAIQRVGRQLAVVLRWPSGGRGTRRRSGPGPDTGALRLADVAI